MKAKLATGLYLLLSVPAFGCASAPTPTEQMTSAKAAVRSAEELGASGVPAADLHVKLAQEQIAHASKLMEDGENERAKLMLQRAAADAELALALAKEAAARNAAQQEQQSVIQPKAAPQPEASLQIN
jgi:uncharacterized protein (DUF1501 family)